MKNCYSCSEYLDEKHLYKGQCVNCLGKERDAFMELVKGACGDCFGVTGEMNEDATILAFRAVAIGYLGGPKLS